MNYILTHAYAHRSEDVSVESAPGNKAIVKYSTSGEMAVRHPGAFRFASYASYHVVTREANTDPQGRPPRRPTDSKVLHTLPLTLRIYTPDGHEFAADHVTLTDLRKFRDMHGVTQGSWRFEVSGQSAPILVDPPRTDPDGELGFKRRIEPGHVNLSISLDETVSSQSAGPLVNSALPQQGSKSFAFDLFRVGQFSARVNTRGPLSQWNGVMNLKDPDGQVVATSTSGRLLFPVLLRTLDKSRGAGGVVRPWTLEVAGSGVGTGRGANSLTATVMTHAKIATSVLNDRLTELLGINGSKISIYGETRNGRAVCRLNILDPYTAETVDMYDLLEKPIKANDQDAGVDKDNLQVKDHVPYVIAGGAALLTKIPGLDSEVTFDVSSVKVKSFNIALGASTGIQPPIPALKFTLEILGRVVIKIGNIPVGSVGIRGGRLEMEVGMTADATGALATVASMSAKPLDLDIDARAILLVGPVFLGLTAIVTELVEREVNDAIVSGIKTIVSQAVGQAPHIIALLLGGYFDVQPPRLEGGDIVFDYVAPLEPDPKPSQNYSGAIGRDNIGGLGGSITFIPRSLGDTWKAENLHKNIDHIVMVMMENRSFDHVLGYRAQVPGVNNADGLQRDLTDFLAARGFPVPKLNQSAIVPNGVHLKTKFPVSVHHESKDVKQQLSEQLQMPSGRMINSPKGFVDNFSINHGLVKEDVLGFYEGSDLPFYKYLAENYAYCEQYFSSHPGPTLPNRMYALTGDLQYDRVGEAIVDNNSRDNHSLFLSRAMSIFDLLSRQGVPWRVYESFPSVAMLRMFARYSTDTTNIVPLSRLESDIGRGDLPAFTVVEPAMHHAPQDDDHPTADMYQGQLFVKRVYDALRSNPELWKKTMLVITYDEHGGFYDHVIPPAADVRKYSELGTPGSPSSPSGMASIQSTPYGVRVPTFVVSPWVPAGEGPSLVLDHCSILKTVVARFGAKDKSFISDRVAASQTFESFLTEGTARQVPPPPALAPLPRQNLTGGPSIITRPISRKEMREGTADFHEITGMVARLLGRR